MSNKNNRNKVFAMPEWLVYNCSLHRLTCFSHKSKRTGHMQSKQNKNVLHKIKEEEEEEERERNRDRIRERQRERESDRESHRERDQLGSESWKTGSGKCLYLDHQPSDGLSRHSPLLDKDKKHITPVPTWQHTLKTPWKLEIEKSGGSFPGCPGIILRGACLKTKSPLLSPQWGTVDEEIKFPSVEKNPELIGSPFKPGIGQHIAMHAAPIARDFFLTNFYPSSPFTCISSKTSPDFFLCGPAE